MNYILGDEVADHSREKFAMARINESAAHKSILQAQSISIYVPSGMHELQLELVAVTS